MEVIGKQIEFLSKEAAGQPDKILGGEIDNGSASKGRHVRAAV